VLVVVKELAIPCDVAASSHGKAGEDHHLGHRGEVTLVTDRDDCFRADVPSVPLSQHNNSIDFQSSANSDEPTHTSVREAVEIGTKHQSTLSDVDVIHAHNPKASSDNDALSPRHGARSAPWRRSKFSHHHLGHSPCRYR